MDDETIRFLRMQQAVRLANAMGLSETSPKRQEIIKDKMEAAEKEIASLKVSLNVEENRLSRHAAFQMGINGPNELNIAASGHYSPKNAVGLSGIISNVRTSGRQRAATSLQPELNKIRNEKVRTITEILEKEIQEEETETNAKAKAASRAKAKAEAEAEVAAKAAAKAASELSAAAENAKIKAAAERILSPRMRAPSESTIFNSISPRGSFASTASTASTGKKNVWGTPRRVNFGGKHNNRSHKKNKKHNRQTKRLRRRS
jgi:hypothetical protein